MRLQFQYLLWIFCVAGPVLAGRRACAVRTAHLLIQLSKTKVEEARVLLVELRHAGIYSKLFLAQSQPGKFGEDRILLQLLVHPAMEVSLYGLVSRLLVRGHAHGRIPVRVQVVQLT